MEGAPGPFRIGHLFCEEQLRNVLANQLAPGHEVTAGDVRLGFRI